MKMWKGVVTKTRNGTVHFYPFFSVFPDDIFCHKLKNHSLGISKIILKLIRNELENNKAFNSIPLWVLVTTYMCVWEDGRVVCIGVIMTTGSKTEILRMRGILTRLEIT